MLEQAISSFAVAGFFIVAAGYFLIQIFKTRTLKKHGVKAAATIISRGAVSNGYAGKFGTSHNFSIEYEFTAADGKTYRRKVQNLRKPEFDAYEEGQQLDIVYAPKNPANNVIQTKLANQNIVMILFFAGCCYIVLSYITNIRI